MRPDDLTGPELRRSPRGTKSTCVQATTLATQTAKRTAALTAGP